MSLNTDKSSVYTPAFLTSWSCCASHSHCTLFYSLVVIAPRLYVFAPPWMTFAVCEKKNMNCYWIKGTQQRLVWFGTLSMWLCIFHKLNKFIVSPPFFECVRSYVCVCKTVCMWAFCGGGVDLVCVCARVCVCVMRKTTLNLLIP